MKENSTLRPVPAPASSDKANNNTTTTATTTTAAISTTHIVKPRARLKLSVTWSLPLRSRLSAREASSPPTAPRARRRSDPPPSPSSCDSSRDLALPSVPAAPPSTGPPLDEGDGSCWCGDGDVNGEDAAVVAVSADDDETTAS